MQHTAVTQEVIYMNTILKYVNFLYIYKQLLCIAIKTKGISFVRFLKKKGKPIHLTPFLSK